MAAPGGTGPSERRRPQPRSRGSPSQTTPAPRPLTLPSLPGLPPAPPAPRPRRAPPRLSRSASARTRRKWRQGTGSGVIAEPDGSDVAASSAAGSAERGGTGPAPGPAMDPAAEHRQQLRSVSAWARGGKHGVPRGLYGWSRGCRCGDGSRRVPAGLRVWDLEVPGSQENRRVLEGTRASRAGRGHAGAPGGFRGFRTGFARCDPRLLPSCGTSCWSTIV